MADRYEPVGVDWCAVHQGLRNEDESQCDMGRGDILDCVFDALYVKVEQTHVGRRHLCACSSFSGVDMTALDDPNKVWRCDACGAEGTHDDLARSGSSADQS